MISIVTTTTCRKSGFPVACPRCGQRTGRPNGLRTTRAHLSNQAQVFGEVAWLPAAQLFAPAAEGRSIPLSAHDDHSIKFFPMPLWDSKPLLQDPLQSLPLILLKQAEKPAFDRLALHLNQPLHSMHGHPHDYQRHGLEQALG